MEGSIQCCVRLDRNSRVNDSWFLAWGLLWYRTPKMLDAMQMIQVYFKVAFWHTLSTSTSREWCIAALYWRRMAPYKFTKNIAVLMSGNTSHKTGDCNYREKKEMRVACSISYCRPEQKDCKGYSGRCHISFSCTWQHRMVDETKRSYVGRRKQAWTRQRKIPAQAEAGKCDSDPWKIRKLCQKSCGTFIEDDRY